MREIKALLKIAEGLIEDREVSESDIKRFVASMQKMVDAYYTKKFPRQGSLLKIIKGKRYYKIAKTNLHDGEEGQTSVWGFIEKSNGDILMAAGWKKPAKHARGNIFDKSSWRNMGPYGPAYLR